MAKGYVILGPFYEYNDSDYSCTGSTNFISHKIYLDRQEAEKRCKEIWVDAFTNKDVSFEYYDLWPKKAIPNINRELFSINSEIYLHTDQPQNIPSKLSDMEFNILKKYWAGPIVAYIKEVEIG